jgi:LuxR family transcriptional regulator, maltose regulon positive regulatory protein
VEATSTASHVGEQADVVAPPVVAREALFETLSAAERAGGVTLVSAPAGSGKTILLRSWLDGARLRDRAAWVSVERGEQDAQRFWLSLIEQLRAAVGAEAFVERLAPTPEFEGTAVVERLRSELQSLEEPVVLVIDDLHELASAEALAQLEALLAQRPSLLRVVLATRRDPQLGLHRLRLAGQLTEIRASDLRFTLEETHELLADSGVVLADESIAFLHARTEGWAAGLRLAALSLAGHPEPERFVEEFSGSERTVADYLLAEVLERQPDDVRRLLLRTSILERVNGALADILTEASGSEGILHGLERANAFVVALDAERSWFRYHSLFADLLRLELRRTESNVVRELHQAAADWYAQHEYPVEAIRHAQAAEDWQNAARMLADHTRSLYLRGQGATARTLLAAFPASELADPELTLLRASEPIRLGMVEDAAAYVASAEANASAVPAERRHLFQVNLAAVRLALARTRGDAASVLGDLESLRGLLETQVPSEVALLNDTKAAMLMNLGIAELWSSRSEEAEAHLEQGLELARRIGAPYFEAGCLAHLSMVTAILHSFALGRERAVEAIAIAEAHGWASEATFGGVAPATLAGIEVGQGRFEEAEYWLERAEQVLRPDVEPAAELLLHVVRGELLSAKGREKEAIDAFRASERRQTLLVAPHALRVATRGFLVQALVRVGDTASARATLDEMTEEDRDWGESRAAFASLHLAEGDAEAAVEVLAPMLDGSAPALTTSPVQAFLLDALANEALGDLDAAEASIERALERAEPDGIILPFVTTPVHALLERHPRHRTAHAALLSDILDVLAGSSLPAPAGQRPELREDLSESELRVLRYLPSNLSAPEIGRELYVSLSTIKTHMRHIYAKLGVHRRTEAVDRARELGLLAPSARRR